MAGAGFKDFTAGDILTATQVDEYLMQQTVMRFADSAARTTALSGVLAEGMLSYLNDTNTVQVYNGSAWVNVGGGSPLTTKGDIYTYSTADARLAVGANDTVLTADSSTATGLKWAVIPASDSYTTLASGSLSSTVTSITSISGSYKKLRLAVWDFSGSATSTFAIRVNNDTTTSYLQAASQTSGASMSANSAYLFLTQDTFASSTDAYFWIDFDDYADTTHFKTSLGLSVTKYDSTTYSCVLSRGAYLKTDAITRLDLRFTNDQTMSGSYVLYGVK